MPIVIRIQDGEAHDVPLDEIADAPCEKGFAWVHIEGRQEDAREIIGRFTHVPDAVADTMVAQESRPRCAIMGEAALINLRGPGEMLEGDRDALVSIRVWAQHGLVITVSYRKLGVLEDVCERARKGGVVDPGDLIVALATAITDVLDPEVATMGDCIDDIESALDLANAAQSRQRVAQTRSAAIAYRRFIVPQRQALERLSLARVPWLEEDDHLHLQEATDRYSRMGEELEAVRERAALAHEELTDLRAEQMNQRALVLSIVALVFLPLTFLTGLLGMNVAGIPFAHESWAFWGVAGVCVAIAVGVTGWFVWKHWVE